jgi:Protein of unknown function (DUF3108)
MVAGMVDIERIARALSVVAATTLTVALGHSPASARADEFRARYTVSLLGINVGEVAAAATMGSNYRINLNAKLTGIAAMVSNVKLALTSTGVVHRDGLVPSTYATTSANSQGTRTVRMSLDGGNVRSVEIIPPFEEKPERVPVTEANKRNILDPTSALIMSIPEGEPLVGPAACNRTIPIYDGYVRFNVTLHYIGQRQVSVAGYSGPVAVCAARYTPISGYSRDSKSTKFMAENRDIEAWLAPVPRAHVVFPLHVRLMTQAGEAEIDAVEFSAVTNGVTAATAH